MSGQEEPQITFTIKNPSKHESDAFKLCVPLSATLADVQRRIAAEYDGNPSPSLQTVSQEPGSSVTGLLLQELVGVLDTSRETVVLAR